MTTHPGAEALKEIVDGLEGARLDHDALFDFACLIRNHVTERATSSRSDALVGTLERFPDTMRSIAAYVAKLEAGLKAANEALAREDGKLMTRCTARDCWHSEYCARHVPDHCDYSSGMDGDGCSYFQKIGSD